VNMASSLVYTRSPRHAFGLAKECVLVRGNCWTVEWAPYRCPKHIHVSQLTWSSSARPIELGGARTIHMCPSRVMNRLSRWHESRGGDWRRDDQWGRDRWRGGRWGVTGGRLGQGRRADRARGVPRRSGGG
jgi:hypothetical protein